MTTYRVKTGSGRPLSAAEISHEDSLRKLVADQLPSIRRAAQRWRDGSGLAGSITTAAGLFTAPDILANAAPWQLSQGGLMIGIAVALGITALAMSLYASVGWPRRADLHSASALDEWFARETGSALWCLRLSMFASILCLVALFLGGSVLLFQVRLWC